MGSARHLRRASFELESSILNRHCGVLAQVLAKKQNKTILKIEFHLYFLWYSIENSLNKRGVNEAGKINTA